MNRQEIFDRVSKHLLTQMRHARDDRGCRYITSSGDRCAIGCLIPDNHPGLNITGSVNTLLQMCPDLKGLWDVYGYLDTTFLNDLQKVHDNYNPNDWKYKLAIFAEKYGLNYE